MHRAPGPTPREARLTAGGRKVPDGAVLVVRAGAWAAFVGAVGADRL
jgi:hypothetical protein